jgi:hypothetical protein
VKYIAHMDSGQEFQVEVSDKLASVFGECVSNEGWLIDNAGIILSIAHLVALVPVAESTPDESANAKPKHIIDNSNSIWHLCPNGYYSLKADNEMAQWTIEEIQESYGIKQFIKD